MSFNKKYITIDQINQDIKRDGIEKTLNLLSKYDALIGSDECFKYIKELKNKNNIK
jgi:hypothetical protein